MTTKFEVTELPAENCPDCNDDSLLLGVEMGIDKSSITIEYQIYCEHEDGCGFTGEHTRLDRLYRTNFNSLDEAKAEANNRAYSEALQTFRENY